MALNQQFPSLPVSPHLVLRLSPPVTFWPQLLQRSLRTHPAQTPPSPGMQEMFTEVQDGWMDRASIRTWQSTLTTHFDIRGIFLLFRSEVKIDQTFPLNLTPPGFSTAVKAPSRWTEFLDRPFFQLPTLQLQEDQVFQPLPPTSPNVGKIGKT